MIVLFSNRLLGLHRVDALFLTRSWQFIAHLMTLGNLLTTDHCPLATKHFLSNNGKPTNLVSDDGIRFIASFDVIDVDAAGKRLIVVTE